MSQVKDVRGQDTRAGQSEGPEDALSVAWHWESGRAQREEGLTSVLGELFSERLERGAKAWSAFPLVLARACRLPPT